MKFHALLLALIAVVCLGTPGTAAAAAAPADKDTPVVVGERRFTSAELTSAARRHDGDLRAAAYDLIHAEWIAREAAARGLIAPPELIDAAAAADRALFDNPKMFRIAYDRFLAGIPATVEERRADIGSGILEELVIDAVVRDAGPNPQAVGRAFRQLAAGGRAITTCLAAYAPEGRNSCSNTARDARKQCVQVGIDDVCSYAKDGRYAASWGGQPDLIIAFLDAPKAALGAVDPDGDRALARLRRYLRAHAPQTLRRCDFDADDLAYFSCPTRADATVILYAATRIHQKAKQTWSVPATAGVVS